MERPFPHVLLCGVSTRAAAESASRAGFAVTAIDAFGDLDQHPGVRARSVPRDFGRAFTAHAAARAAGSVSCDAVAYLSPFENHPRAVDALARGRTLWGNPPAVLRRVRDPLRVAQALRARGFPAPAVRLNDPNASNDPNDSIDWILKPLSSGGGRRVRRWRPGTRVPRGHYLQEAVRGVPGSIVFAASGSDIVPLGVSRQLVGEALFGAGGYRYCGSVLSAEGDLQFPRDGALMEAAGRLARAMVEAFGLVGVNGIDFIACDGVPYAIEINPRWCASMELVERAYGISLFAAHVGACRDGVLPQFDLARARCGPGAIGKAVVFARRPVVGGDTRRWLSDDSVRDVPHPGERIAVGQPVCTVFAAGHDAAECHAALASRAAGVHAVLASWGQPS